VFAEDRRAFVAMANARARAAGLPRVISVHDHDIVLGKVLTLLRRDFPDAYRAAVAEVDRATARGS
jgi:hypothetical protein